MGQRKSQRLKGKGSDRGSRNGQKGDEKRILEEESKRTGQSEERRRAGGRRGHEKVLCLVKLKGQGRQRGMKEFYCPDE